MLLHPEVARRSCADCQKYLYDDRPDAFAVKPIERGGKPVERIPLKQLPLCRFCPKVPVGADPRPASAVELSERNATAYMHYRRCKAVGRFPEDPIVERNAALMLHVEEEAREHRLRDEQMSGLARLLAVMGRK